MTLEDALAQCPVVAIVRGVRPDEILDHAEALFTAGVRGVEVPLNSPDPLASIRWLKEHNEVRVRHQERADTLKRRMIAAGLPVMPSVSHIVPVLVGDPVHCKMISDMLLTDHGVYVQPINYPTVPRGTERLRFTPTPFHTDAMMNDLVEALAMLWTRCNVQRLGGYAA